jgi:hypothetical protein
MRTLIASLLLLLGLVSCSPSQDQDITGAIGSCSAKLYSPYDPKNMKQCVDVCLKCNRGIQTTCSTSCTLKGAH